MQNANENNMETKYHRLVRLILAERHSKTEISEQCRMSRTTVIKWAKALNDENLGWEAYLGKSDLEIRKMVFPRSGQRRCNLLAPDWSKVRKEHRAGKVIKKILYDEFVDDAPDGANVMSLSRFYELFDEDIPKRGAEMLFSYLGGEMCQFDFVGKRPDLLVDKSGSPIRYEVGVAVSCASRLIFAKAIQSQRTECSIKFICDMFEFFGGVQARLVVDNFKAAVLTPRRRNEPALINPRFQACADHYQIGLSPARGNHPRDKGMAENSVLQVQRSILMPLRNRKFLSFGPCAASLLPLNNDCHRLV